MNNCKTIVINDSVKVSKLNKNGKVINYNPLTKNYTIFIPSIPSRKDQYIYKKIYELKKIPSDGAQIDSTHIIPIVDAKNIKTECFIRTIDFVKLLNNYDDIGYVLESLESFSDPSEKLDLVNKLSELYKHIIDLLLNINNSIKQSYLLGEKYLEPNIELSMNLIVILY